MGGSIPEKYEILRHCLGSPETVGQGDWPTARSARRPKGIVRLASDKASFAVGSMLTVDGATSIW
ncbi:MAG TPA: hypothetical protein VGN91_07180 [Bosea sp. (in: a-proteobacteria)]|jgi:hypothetical protein|nr:hypothetical protein [Bosea sp. (in: a-proteobacteria)]